ncbi:hypothetical protein PM082_004274 [Marasmius tenuissimus]|nr:hypothetical protein PM082_004274 [Marasmius tenuissimus]
MSHDEPKEKIHSSLYILIDLFVSYIHTLKMHKHHSVHSNPCYTWLSLLYSPRTSRCLTTRLQAENPEQNMKGKGRQRTCEFHTFLLVLTAVKLRAAEASFNLGAHYTSLL